MTTMRQTPGFILWLTGMSGAGKSTLSRALREQLEPVRAVWPPRRASPSWRSTSRPCLDVLIARDMKGLYKKALAGEIPHFTGVSDPYEAPETPEAIVRSDVEPVEAGLVRVVEVLRARGLVASAVAT
jgi:adenylylsulfate kinase-like enzyme